MKIVHIVTYSVFGGMSLHVLTAAKRLQELGHDVEILSMCDGPLVPEYRKAGLPVTVVPDQSEKMARTPLAAVHAVNYIRRFLIEKKVDVVHTHGPRANLLAGCAARMARVPVIVATIHGSFKQFTAGQDVEMSNWEKRKKSLQYGGIDWLTSFIAHRLVAVCSATARELRDLHVRASRINVINNGIEDQQFDTEDVERWRADLGFDDNEKVVAYAGRLAYHKGSKDLLDAMPIIAAQVPEARFLIIGDGPMMAEMKARSQMDDLRGKVVFTGIRDDAVSLMATADLVVLPSLSEGPSLMLVEAAMLGRAAVAARVGGIPDVVLDGRTGLLVSPRAHKELAAAVTRLLRDDSERQVLAAAAREMWEKRPFSAECMTLSMQDLYRDLLTGDAV